MLLLVNLPVAAQSPAQALYEETLALEREGKGREAVRTYIRAARAGNAPAAKRLQEIHEKGVEAQPLIGEPLIGDFPMPAERQRDRSLPPR